MNNIIRANVQLVFLEITVKLHLVAVIPVELMEAARSRMILTNASAEMDTQELIVNMTLVICRTVPITGPVQLMAQITIVFVSHPAILVVIAKIKPQ